MKKQAKNRADNFPTPPDLTYTIRIERAAKSFGHGYVVAINRVYIAELFETLDAAVKEMKRRTDSDEIDPFTIFWVFGDGIQTHSSFRFVHRFQSGMHGPFPNSVANAFARAFGGRCL